ncbi:hypothetical protein JTB14_030402 [Gonioctena quinquepunctata]|nr:hypothetical protein JTB14_030402 [Gonioctena quinquepunctata]
MKFTTKDYDQDTNHTGNCAEAFVGAWWFHNCYQSSLNGAAINRELSSENFGKGAHWISFNFYTPSLSETRMLIRPLDPAGI